MRYYETMMILKSSLDHEGTEGVITNFKDLIQKLGGKVIDEERWGRRKLAYPIKHQESGIYTILYFTGDGDLVEELDRVMKITDEVMRYRIVKREDLLKKSLMRGE